VFIFLALLDFVAVINVDLLKRQMPHHGERRVQSAAAGDKTWHESSIHQCFKQL